MEYASQCSDAPDIFHIGVGLTIFSAAVARTARAPYMAGRQLIPNLYTLLVGPSRSARKTASLDIGIEILRRANPEAVIPLPGSYEEMIAQLRATPVGLLEYREFGHFLKTTARGYGEPIRTVLMDLYDWPPDQPYIRNLRKGKTVVEAPIVLSMASGIATELLFSYSDLESWTGGFFGRCLMLYGERDMFRMPTPWEEARDSLTQQLRAWCNITLPPCGGFARDAWTAFEQWSRWRDSKANEAPDRVQTFFAGAPTLAAKIALLYAIDQHEPLAGAGWLISYESVRKAALFVDTLYLPSIMHLGERFAITPFEKDRQFVLDIIDRSGRRGASRAEILRRTKNSVSNIDAIIDALTASGEAVPSNGAGGTVFKRPAAGGHLALVGGNGGAGTAGAGGQTG